MDEETKNDGGWHTLRSYPCCNYGNRKAQWRALGPWRYTESEAQADAHLEHAVEEARRFHSVLHDAASGGCLHTMLRHEHTCALESIKNLKEENAQLRWQCVRLAERLELVTKQRDSSNDKRFQYDEERDAAVKRAEEAEASKAQLGVHVISEEPERRAPVQADGGPHPEHPAGTISWEEHLEAWKGYNAKWRCGQSAERIAERHGFGYSELVELLGREPTTWRPR